MPKTTARRGKRRMSRYKSKDDAIKLAASIMGKVGGSRNTEAQKKSRSRAVAIMNDCDVSARNKASAQKIDEETRITRAKKAISARWKSSQEAMSADEFRERTAGMTAAAIADKLGIGVSKVNSWRRATKPVRITDADASAIREKFPHKN